MIRHIIVEREYNFESDIETHINGDDLSELSDFFEESSNIRKADSGNKAISLDEISYSRDLSLINVPSLAAKPKVLLATKPRDGGKISSSDGKKFEKNTPGGKKKSSDPRKEKRERRKENSAFSSVVEDFSSSVNVTENDAGNVHIAHSKRENRKKPADISSHMNDGTEASFELRESNNDQLQSSSKFSAGYQAGRFQNQRGRSDRDRIQGHTEKGRFGRQRPRRDFDPKFSNHYQQDMYSYDDSQLESSVYNQYDSYGGQDYQYGGEGEYYDPQYNYSYGNDSSAYGADYYRHPSRGHASESMQNFSGRSQNYAIAPTLGESAAVFDKRYAAHQAEEDQQQQQQQIFNTTTTVEEDLAAVAALNPNAREFVPFSTFR